MALKPKLFLARLVWAISGAMLASAPAVAAPSLWLHRRQASIPFTRAQVASNDGRTFEVTWLAPAATGDVALYASEALGPDGQLSEPRLVGHGSPAGDVVIADLPPKVRWYFELRPTRGDPLVVADRSLHFASAPNFRDAGGYRTIDGRWVRMGLAYRSDQLNRLSDEDYAKLGRLAPSLIIDLRTKAERQSGPDRLPIGAEPRVDDVLGDDPLISSALKQAPGPDKTIGLMTEVNRTFVSSANAKAAYSRLFSSDLQTPAVIVFHCTAGKDRTGWATAVLLSILGVPRETVMADYLASNQYLVEKNRVAYAAMSPAMAQTIEPALTVRSVYLQAAFDEVDRRYGSFAKYLQLGLGLDASALERLRARYLEGRP